ncbi:hypothetical protein TSAR_003957 [Trichomalopsis sarcophagae]|uniref:Ribosomal protein mS38 C-terminal domain-containing protein n=1 Tax=Trichomalopsis sarcophagae TaxID=543379 RepID=A0A232ESJ1_9HYME|nr:hypothetical protein TSAR_003957 [Trichomalopsis sarcophagae]
MAVCTLLNAFRRLNIFRKGIISAHLSTQHTELPLKANLILLQPEKLSNKHFENHVTFTARSVNLNFDIPRNGLPISKIIECPVIPNFQIDEPVKNKIEKSDIVPNKVIETPGTNIIEKQAARLIVIRRRKMKKHKRRKFLKRMKFVILKRRQKKKLLRERAFQAELQEIYAKAEQFNPKEYVAEQLHILKRERLPTKWRGEVVPESMIIQFMKEKADKKAHKQRLHNYRLKLD